jgi:hypothetical protein
MGKLRKVSPYKKKLNSLIRKCLPSVQ